MGKQSTCLLYPAALGLSGFGSPSIREFIQGLPVGTGWKWLLQEDGAAGKGSDIAALLQTLPAPGRDTG